MGKLLLFYTEMISAYVLLRGELQTDAKYSNFDIFESTLYMKSGNIALKKFTIQTDGLITGDLVHIVSHKIWCTHLRGKVSLRSGSYYTQD